MRISDWSSDVCSSDLMSTADNFPALDLVDGNVRMRSRTTGNALDDLNAFDNALDAGERIDINIDGGTVYPVKSRAVSARSEERSVGKECVRKSRYRWLSDH